MQLRYTWWILAPCSPATGTRESGARVQDWGTFPGRLPPSAWTVVLVAYGEESEPSRGFDSGSRPPAMATRTLLTLALCLVGSYASRLPAKHTPLGQHSRLVGSHRVLEPRARAAASALEDNTEAPVPGAASLAADAAKSELGQELNEVELAEQVRALDTLADQWRSEVAQQKFDKAQLLGFCDQAEIINARFAMFFVATGLLTEYWTGQSIPQQVLTMLETTGVLPPS